ncbi:MAG: VCBS repeat-containing protein, partial [Flavobacteriaceae bacterium]
MELLPSQQTGITFNNAITESETINHIYYNQIYSGSGVAIGDLNNDGLPDIYFGGNQVKDKLYLNKGGLKFQDISETSKISRSSGWTWGVTMA